jgi:hypothetical protein
VMYDRGAYEESYVRSSMGKWGRGSARFRMPETSFQSKRVGCVLIGLQNSLLSWTVYCTSRSVPVQQCKYPN